jgi:hypothetical protein
MALDASRILAVGKVVTNEPSRLFDTV